MRNISFRLSLIALLAFLLTAASCKKKVERELEKEAARMEGTWRVMQIRYVTTDSMGNTLNDTLYADQGSIEFKRSSGEDADVFDPALFHGACSNSELVNYFRGLAGGDRIPDGWALYWEADPNGERLMVWGIGPSSSYHRTVNLRYEGKGKSARTMSYVYSPGGNPDLKVFASWELEK